MTHDNYYQILGVGPKASPEEIKRAYRKLISEWHPDLHAERKDEAEEKTKILNQAYYVLRDPNRRKQYDRMMRYTQGRKQDQGIDAGAFDRKIHRQSPLLKRMMVSVLELYDMYKDAFKGRYKLHPATLGMISGGLLYFLMPLDAIPDFIPIVGLLDDMAVIASISHSLKKELEAYRIWKKENLTES